MATLTNLGKAANSVFTSANANNLLTDDGTGKFGLGTESPSQILEVSGATADLLSLFRPSNGATESSAVSFRLNDSASAIETYAAINGGIVTNTAGSEDGFLSLRTIGSGTLTERFRIDQVGKLSSGNETSPDVNAGGLTLNQGTGSGNILTLKQANIAHGITDEAETDTYVEILQDGAGTGGLFVRGYTEGTVGINLLSHITTETTTDTSASSGAFKIGARLKTGSGTTVLGDTANVVVFQNVNTTLMLLKGNGDMHIANTTLTALDEEDDINLARNLQLITTDKYKHKVSKIDFTKLVSIGALSSTGDFQITQGCTAITLGAISQLFNIFRGLFKELGISEQKLLTYAKCY